MAKLNKEKTLNEFREVFYRVHGNEPIIEEFKSGWYSVNGSDKMRLKKIKEMITQMETQETQTTEAPESTEQPVALGIQDLTVLYQAVNLAAKKGAYEVADFVHIGVATQNLKRFLAAHAAATQGEEGPAAEATPADTEDAAQTEA